MGDDLYKDVEDVKRWLTRFVPELEQQLANLGTDNFTTAYNERVEGLTTLSGAPGSKTTAEAVAEHLLDTNNPHKVTLAQLGYEAPRVRVTEKNGTYILDAVGLIIQVKPVDVSADTATAEGNVFKRTVALGDWEQEFGTIYIAIAVPYSGNVWLGTRSDASNISAGNATLYSAVAEQTASRIYIIGIGR